MDIKTEAFDVVVKHAKACAIELISGPVVDEVLEEVKKAIPGQIDDAVIELLKAPLKAALLAKLQAV